MAAAGRSRVPQRALARRLERLPEVEVLGTRVRVAAGAWSRLWGLAGIAEARAGGGLLIPRCRSVHTVGMRFSLDVYFLDRDHAVVARHLAVAPMRIVSNRDAAAVLELPSEGGEFPPATA